MDFTLSSEQIELQDSVRKFAKNELTTVAAEIERTGKPPTKKIIQKFSDMGFLGVNLPQKYGGLGMSNFEAVLVLEEVAKISIALAFPVFESCFGPALAISYFASEKLKEKTLFKVCSGNMILAVAMSEPHAGSALTDLSTSATISNGRILVNGTKRWCSGASHADAYVVYCKMSNERGANGIGAVLIEKNRPGLSFGKKERHMGWRGVVSADMHFDNISLPLENIVLPAGGFKKLMKAFDLERCGNTTMSLACAQSAFDYVLNYVQERKQFGKQLIDFQAVQISIAEMKMKLDASRMLLYRAVTNTGGKLPTAGESSIAKCYANEICREVTGKAMQLMGAYGYSSDYPIEQKFRDSWGWGIAGGAIDIQKTNIAASLIGRRFNQRD
ncbi:MAG: acyl-CoA/acyl-ACP dehydrogenase [Rhodobacteraceae bacterium]|nr:acyl-CoA/acyl-ACP dehydrogenase [Paracoccaceae bacterium]MBT6271744.1 acyl-CoA/acyl-ACP dehydrogenase [Paracoccaceae bacterium]